MSEARRHTGMIMALYLFGIFMGALDTGIVTPARTIIQNDLGVDDQLGIWMITIYTLAYAAAIPIMGKLADRMGRKKIYLVAIVLFGLGSLLSGLAQDVGSFWMLIGARAVQALGGGGLLPIATAEFGTSVPEEKRGMALGLVGAVFGVANVFGASAGSLILDIAGAHNWQWIFYVNLPISVAIVALGLKFLPDHTAAETKRIDVLGSLVLVVMILSLLYGMRNLDFFDLAGTASSPEVWPFLAAFVVLLPVLVLVERRAEDPVLNLGYFTNRGLALTLLLALLTGVILMGVIFVPQFAENALKVPSGKGGYFVIILGLASGVGAPLSGTLTDRFGPKPVLGFGCLVSLAAAATAVWWVVPNPGMVNVVVTLVLMGLGLGFVVGSALNYMMLERTPTHEANSALATLSLVRSIGTTVAPAIMVGFIANAALGMQTSVTAVLPTRVEIPPLPHAQQLVTKITELKKDPDLAKDLAGVDVSNLTRTSIDIDTAGRGTLPDDLVEKLRTADATTITDVAKEVASRQFAEQTPGRVKDIVAGVDSGLGSLRAADAKMTASLKEMDASLAKMATSLKEMDANLATMASGIRDLDAKAAQLRRARAQQAQGIAGMDRGIAGMRTGVAGLRKAITGMDAGLAQQQAARARLAAAPASPQVQGQIAGLDAAIAKLTGERKAASAQLNALQKKLTSTQAARAKLVAARAQLGKALDGVTQGRAKLASGRAELSKARAKLASGRAELASGRGELDAARADLRVTTGQLVELKDAVPGAFATAEKNYLAEIDARRPQVEAAFQTTLNEGFRGLYLFYAGACALALLALAAVPAPPARERQEPVEA